MYKTFLNSKIHNAKVTESRIEYEGSLGVDEELMHLAGMLNGEKVEIYNITNGKRLSTYIIPLERGSGKISVFGAAARKINPGDRIIIATYVQLSENEWAQHKPKVVRVDKSNQPV